MDFRDVVRSGLDEYLGDLEKAVDGLTPVELAWRPTPSSNNITWQVWHMARVEDRWVNSYLRQSTEVWITKTGTPNSACNLRTTARASLLKTRRRCPRLPWTT